MKNIKVVLIDGTTITRNNIKKAEVGELGLSFVDEDGIEYEIPTHSILFYTYQS